MIDPDHAPPMTLDRAAFVVSIDTELAWGIHDQGSAAVAAQPPGRAAGERSVVQAILAAADEARIPITWAVVGHLFLDRCDGEHAGMPRPTPDWFASDPGTDAITDPLWYAPDIVAMIRSAAVDHEIGSHTFSHVVAGDPRCNREMFTADLGACRAAAETAGVTLRSLVFSKNSIAHRDVVAEAGFTAYRGNRPVPFADRGSVVGKARRMLDKAIPGVGSSVLPRRVDGLWEIPGTNFYGPQFRPRRIPFGWWVGQQVRRLDLAVRTRSLYHLWFHPQDLLVDTSRWMTGLHGIFERAAFHRERHTLDTMTMGGLAERLDAGRTRP